MRKIFPMALLIFCCLLMGSCLKEEPSIITVEEPTTQKVITMEDVFAAISDQNWNTINVRFKQEQGAEYVRAQIFLKKLEGKRAQIKITASFSRGQFHANPMHLTTILYDGGNLYVNQKELCDYLLAMDEQYIMMTGFFRAFKEYVSVTREDIGGILEEKGWSEEKELYYEFTGKTINDIRGEAEKFLTLFQEKNPLFELTEESASLQADREKMQAVRDTLKEMNAENSFLENLDFGKMEFGVSEKDKLYLRGEWKNSSTGETGDFNVDFTNEPQETVTFPEPVTNFADFMKVYDRIKKLFGMVS